ncbi:MAG: class I SAM-dependent methyltransferase [Candidatus Omnitrophica bacterium]|nr:class I SAM-dependent methyltransferase [Candidatus Omnitrophota bacterium]
MKTDIYSQKAWVDKFISRCPADDSDAERVRKIVEMIPVDVSTVLDVGIGGGYIYKELRKKKSLRCAGIDLSLELVKRLDEPAICVGDAGEIPFRSEHFDLVLAADLLEHIKDEFFKQTVSEIKRVSRKYILINSPYKDAIDWPVALCDRCNGEFNVYGHMQVIDTGLIRRAFPKEEFDVVISEIFGRKRSTRPAPLVYIARRFGKVYSEEGAVCPYCFNISIRPPDRNFAEVLIGRMMAATFFFMDRAVPSLLKQGSEIRVLLRKKDAIQ